MHHLGEVHAFCASDVRDMGRAVLLDCLDTSRQRLADGEPVLLHQSSVLDVL